MAFGASIIRPYYNEMRSVNSLTSFHSTSYAGFYFLYLSGMQGRIPPEYDKNQLTSAVSDYMFPSFYPPAVLTKEIVLIHRKKAVFLQKTHYCPSVFFT